MKNLTASLAILMLSTHVFGYSGPQFKYIPYKHFKCNYSIDGKAVVKGTYRIGAFVGMKDEEFVAFRYSGTHHINYNSKLLEKAFLEKDVLLKTDGEAIRLIDENAVATDVIPAPSLQAFVAAINNSGMNIDGHFYSETGKDVVLSHTTQLVTNEAEDRLKVILNYSVNRLNDGKSFVKLLVIKGNCSL